MVALTINGQSHNIDVDPTTGHYFDDTGRYIENTPNLSANERVQIYRDNILKVYPRLKAHLSSASAP